MTGLSVRTWTWRPDRPPQSPGTRPTSACPARQTRANPRPAFSPPSALTPQSRIARPSDGVDLDAEGGGVGGHVIGKTQRSFVERHRRGHERLSFRSGTRCCCVIYRPKSRRSRSAASLRNSRRHASTVRSFAEDREDGPARLDNGFRQWNIRERRDRFLGRAGRRRVPRTVAGKAQASPREQDGLPDHARRRPTGFARITDGNDGLIILERLPVPRQGPQAGGMLDDLGGGRVARIDLDGIGHAAAQDEVHAEKPLQPESLRQSGANIGDGPLGLFRQDKRADAAAVMERGRMQPRFADELARHAEQLGPLPVADIDGGAGVALQELLPVTAAFRMECPAVPGVDTASPRAVERLDQPLPIGGRRRCRPTTPRGTPALHDAGRRPAQTENALAARHLLGCPSAAAGGASSRRSGWGGSPAHPCRATGRPCAIPADRGTRGGSPLARCGVPCSTRRSASANRSAQIGANQPGAPRRQRHEHWHRRSGALHLEPHASSLPSAWRRRFTPRAQCPGPAAGPPGVLPALPLSV